MFNFIKKAPNISPKWFVRYMACQHPLGFLQSFLLVDSIAIYSKHNLDPITFLLKPFQWFSTVLWMESTFLDTACIAGPLACISYCFLSPCPLVSAFQSLSLWSFSLFCSWMTPVHPLDPLPIYPSSFNLWLTSSGASSGDEVRSHVTYSCHARVFSFLTFIALLLFLNCIYVFQFLNRLYIHTVQKFSKDVHWEVLGPPLFHFAWLPTYLKKKHQKTPLNPFPEGLPWVRIHLLMQGMRFLIAGQWIKIPRVSGQTKATCHS